MNNELEFIDILTNPSIPDFRGISFVNLTYFLIKGLNDDKIFYLY